MVPLCSLCVTSLSIVVCFYCESNLSLCLFFSPTVNNMCFPTCWCDVSVCCSMIRLYLQFVLLPVPDHPMRGGGEDDDGFVDLMMLIFEDHPVWGGWFGCIGDMAQQSSRLPTTNHSKLAPPGDPKIEAEVANDLPSPRSRKSSYSRDARGDSTHPMLHPIAVDRGEGKCCSTRRKIYSIFRAGSSLMGGSLLSRIETFCCTSGSGGIFSEGLLDDT